MSDGQKMTADQFKALFGAPRLIKGESEDAYWNWWSAIAGAYNPETFFDWIHVNDYATKSWEQQRLQRYNSHFVDGALVRALQNLLTDSETGRNSGLSRLERDNLAEEYYFGSEKIRGRATAEVASRGITDEQIVAEATRLRAGDLVMLDRLDNQRANAKRSVQKEMDRRMEARRKSSGSTEAQA
jgi:hypothetical protein